MKATPETEERIMLCTVPEGRDLDQYLFTDLAHAVGWLQQPIIIAGNHSYCIELVTLRYKKHQCPSCGHREYTVKSRKRMSVGAFLATHQKGVSV